MTRSGFFAIIVLALSLFTLQSCIELTEEVVVNKDRSGTLGFSLRINSSGSIMGLINQFADNSYMDDIDDEVQNVVSQLKQQPGISNVKFSKENSGKLLNLSFDFSDDKSLNKALYALAGEKKTFYKPSVYKVRTHKFVRKNLTEWAKDLIEEQQESIPDDLVFSFIKVKTKVHLPEPARSVSVKNAVMSKDKKTVTLTNELSNILEQNQSTGFRIRY